MEWKRIFCKVLLHYVIVILGTLPPTGFGISLHHGEKLFNKKCYSTSSHISYFHKSGSSNLTLAGTLICFITPTFLYTKKYVRISPICGCNSNWNIEFLIFRKMDLGNESIFHISWLKWIFYLSVQILHCSVPINEVWIGCPKKERHILSYHFKKWLAV